MTGIQNKKSIQLTILSAFKQPLFAFIVEISPNNDHHSSKGMDQKIIFIQDVIKHLWNNGLCCTMSLQQPASGVTQQTRWESVKSKVTDEDGNILPIISKIQFKEGQNIKLSIQLRADQLKDDKNIKVEPQKQQTFAISSDKKCEQYQISQIKKNEISKIQQIQPPYNTKQLKDNNKSSQGIDEKYQNLQQIKINSSNNNNNNSDITSLIDEQPHPKKIKVRKSELTLCQQTKHLKKVQEQLQPQQKQEENIINVNGQSKQKYKQNIKNQNQTFVQQPKAKVKTKVNKVKKVQQTQNQQRQQEQLIQKVAIKVKQTIQYCKVTFYQIEQGHQSKKNKAQKYNNTNPYSKNNNEYCQPELQNQNLSQSEDLQQEVQQALPRQKNINELQVCQVKKMTILKNPILNNYDVYYDEQGLKPIRKVNIIFKDLNLYCLKKIKQKQSPKNRHNIEVNSNFKEEEVAVPIDQVKSPIILKFRERSIIKNSSLHKLKPEKYRLCRLKSQQKSSHNSQQIINVQTVNTMEEFVLNESTSLQQEVNSKKIPKSQFAIRTQKSQSPLKKYSNSNSNYEHKSTRQNNPESKLQNYQDQTQDNHNEKVKISQSKVQELFSKKLLTINKQQEYDQFNSQQISPLRKIKSQFTRSPVLLKQQESKSSIFKIRKKIPSLMNNVLKIIAQVTQKQKNKISSQKQFKITKQKNMYIKHEQQKQQQQQQLKLQQQLKQKQSVKRVKGIFNAYCTPMSLQKSRSHNN